jgi:hypothetical protein
MYQHATATEETTSVMDNLLKNLPWWVKWIGIPVIALVVFGGIVASLISFVVGLLFKVIVFVILVGALVFVVKRVTSGGGSRRDW